MVVDLAHTAGIQVIPLVGPNAMILALMASGFNGQAFAFHGYLPIKSPERQNAIKDLERRSAANNETELFIETPFRNNAMLQDLCKNLHPATRVCVACNLTCDDELIISQSIGGALSFASDCFSEQGYFFITLSEYTLPPSKVTRIVKVPIGKPFISMRSKPLLCECKRWPFKS